MRELAGQDVCVEPVLDTGEIAAHPAHAGGLWEQPAHGARLRTVAPPIRFSGAAPEPARRAPGLGEHTDAVLGEAGIPSDHIKKMRGEGVLA